MATTGSSSGRVVRLLKPPRRMRRGAIELVCVVAGLVLGLALPFVHTGPTISGTLAAQAMLGLGFGTISLIAVVFTLLFTIVQWVYGTFSLRLRLFESRAIVWWVFGLCIGVFVYSVAATIRVWDTPATSVLVPTVTLVGSLATLFLLLRLQLLAFEAIQLTPTIQRVTEVGHNTIDAMYSEVLTQGEAARPEAGGSEDPGHVSVEWRGGLGVLQEIDGERLAELAAKHESVIVLTRPIGTTVLPGDVIARCTAAVPSPRLLACLTVGAERTLSQDPGFALRLLSDIALRALSPAINDPATAVQALDGIGSLLRDLAPRDLAVGRITDTSGEPRVIVPVPDWPGLLAEALDDLTAHAARSQMAGRRLEAVLAQVTAVCPSERRPPVAARAEQLARLSAAAS